MKDSQRKVIAKTTLRSAGTDIASQLPIVINECHYKEEGRIERRIELVSKNGGTILTIDVCPAGEILIDIGKVYGDKASVVSSRPADGRSTLITIKGHDAVVTDDKRPKHMRR